MLEQVRVEFRLLFTITNPSEDTGGEIDCQIEIGESAPDDRVSVA